MSRFTRRNLLVGSSGVFAIPLLESLMPRVAFGATNAPKRLIIFNHHHGRMVGDGQGTSATHDAWSPATTTGPLPAAMSPTLAPLAAILNEVVTIDKVDNIVRHLASGSNAVDGHYFPTRTHLTCVLPKDDGSGGGPSIDYVVGSRIRANAAMPASVMVSADSGNFVGTDAVWGANGSPGNLLNPDGSPVTAITKLFTGVSTTPPPTPSTRDRLESARSSILNDVLDDYHSVRARVSTKDQQRLDQHIQFITDAATRYSTGSASQPTAGCTPMTKGMVPAKALAYSYSAANDNISVPIMVQAVTQALACDVTRSIVFDFCSDVPTFDWLYPNGTPFGSNVWHAQIHSSANTGVTEANNVKPTYQYYSSVFTSLVQSLAGFTDVDGSRMLDNTLVLWLSDLGYGSTHACFNYPIVMAGMKSAFSKGQGRHVVPSGRITLGDLYAQVLRMFGGTDTTFGVTGTLGTAGVGGKCDGSYCNSMGAPGYINANTPLHTGPIDL